MADRTRTSYHTAQLRSLSTSLFHHSLAVCFVFICFVFICLVVCLLLPKVRFLQLLQASLQSAAER